MKESYYQTNIMKAIVRKGGHAVNGMYSKDGESDIQAGYPCKDRLLYLAVEVKTEKDYHRVMSGVDEVNGLYVIIDDKKLKKHEPLQIAKINIIRQRGGLGLIAYNIDQIDKYINKDTTDE